MKNATKLLCLLLALMMVLPLLAACRSKDKVVPVDIVADGISDYKIIFPEDKNATKEQTAANKLKKAIQNATDVKLTTKNDYYPGTLPATAKEILVGEVKRDEIAGYKELLREREFIIAYENERVIILGGSSDATAEAVEHFISTYIKADEKKVTVTNQLYDLSTHAYMLGRITIEGVPLSRYTVVYPEGADLVTMYVAYNIADYFLVNAGLVLEVKSDRTKESEYEILVGSTNRAASVAGGSVARSSDQYVLYRDGTKIVMQGDSYMVGGAAGAFVNQYVVAATPNADVNVTNLPTSGKAEQHTFKKATSAILMIGDGMGFNHIEAAESYGLTDFVAAELPGKGSCVTASQSVLNGREDFTDSAAAATALATGYKTLNGYIGVDQGGVTRQNVRELAQKAGAKTAVVTTDVITGATPAGFLCHEKSRSNKTALQNQIDKLIKNGDVTYTAGDIDESALTAYTREALRTISEGGGSFFAMIEEAHIDKHSHNNTLAKARMAVKYYNDVIAYVIGFVMMHPETALIVTADHECGQLYLAENGTFVYRPYSDGSYDHSNVNVPLYGLGDGAADFVNSKDAVDNTDIAKFIASIFGDSDFGA